MDRLGVRAQANTSVVTNSECGTARLNNHASLVGLRRATLLCYLSAFSCGKLSGIKALIFKVTAPSFHFSTDATKDMMHHKVRKTFTLAKLAACEVISFARSFDLPTQEASGLRRPICTARRRRSDLRDKVKTQATI